MTNLTEFLLLESDHESKQKASGQFVPDFSEMRGQAPHLTNDLFFKNKDIYISKHNRYAPYPLHSHQFMELNYIFQGSCRQVINGETYQLREGDILLMDTGSQHQIATLGQNDIVINILFKDSNISLNALEHLQENNSILYHLLLNQHSHLHESKNFLILRADTIQKTLPILNQMISEYFFESDFSQQIIKHYLAILLYELARSLPSAQEKFMDQRENPFYQTLQLIDRDYANITLTQAAEQLRFNKNYLSNLIKEKGGKTFTDLVNQKKIMSAKLLIESTDFSIEKICQSVGFSNKTYFYKKFQAYYGQKPSQLRKK